MPLTGICHDFAFSRSKPRAEWLNTPAVLQDEQLWQQIRAGRMARISPKDIANLDSGVLTIANPAKVGGSSAYCTHSYYVDARSRFLLSTNDPFMAAVGPANVVPVAVTDNVTALSYTIADFTGAMTTTITETARIGSDARVFSFYYASETDVQNGGWWH